MNEAQFDPSHRAVLDAMLLRDPRVRAGKMFGYPAYYAGRKLVACLYEGGVGLKVPEALATRLLQDDPNVVPFQPLGRRRMREWIQIDLRRSEDYREYAEVFAQAVEYVAALDQV